MFRPYQIRVTNVQIQDYVFASRSRFGFEFGVEKVDLDGRLQMSLILSSDVPMPHIKGFTMTFLEK